MRKFKTRYIVILSIVGMILIASMLFSKKTYIVDDEPSYPDHVENFIDTIGEEAREIAEENDLYASVMLAQAVLESDKGRSQLAAEPNFNLFGIKGEYKQGFVELETLEDDGKGNMTTVIAKFRKYPSYEASLKDYVKLLREGVSWDEQFYEGVHKSNVSSYQEATAFLTGTYATDSRYEEKLNDLIEQYDLQQYDTPI